MPTPAKPIYEFGPFHLDTAERVLRRDGRPVALPPKAFDVLLMLVESSSRIVEKEALMNRVWADSFVEEGNLKVTVSVLRKALDEDAADRHYIETVPRRGYRFVASVRELPSESDGMVVREPTTSSATIEESEAGKQEQPGDALPAAKRRSKARPVAIASVVVVGLAILGFYLWTNRRAPGPELKTIAVLPFKPLVAETRDEALELGMADALITKLSNLKQLVVRPTSSILRYDKAEQDLMAIGREQRVDLLLEGRVQRSGDNVRVTVQLVRVSDGLPLWAGKFDEKFTSIFSVQDSISRQVTEALVLGLSGEQKQQLAKRYTDNIEAYNLYLKGRFFWNKFNEAGWKKAIEHFNQAITIDPNYALAYAGLSVAYNAEGAIGVAPPAETWAEARRTAQRAVELDDMLAEAHSALGGVKLLYEWDWPAAEQELKRAIELNPNYAEAHELYGYHFWVVGEFDKAISEIRRAQEISPISPILNLDLSTMLYNQGKYDEAIKAYRKAQEMDSNMVGPVFVPGQIYERSGAYAQAIEECQRALSTNGRDPGVLSALGYAYGASGSPNKAQDIIKELEAMWRTRYFSPFLIALVCTGVSDKDRAFAWLTKAYESRDPQLIWLMVEPQLESLRPDPRFRALLRRMGIQQ
jgi:DNA-binding winged helix-turn-helix (wHTH) protein/TolB-like protein/Flp pilus assembly protein TadD